MKKRNLGFKILSVLISAVFLWSGAGWSAPHAAPDISSLRARSAFERNGANPQQRADYEALLSTRGITAQQVTRQIDLMYRERHNPLPIGEYEDFPEPHGASSSPQDRENRQRLIAAGKVKEALSRLAILISGGGEGSRLLTELENTGIITKEEKRELTKVTLPVSPVMGFSTLAIQLQIISNICRKFQVDIPVCVAMSLLESNQPLLERFLEENGNFGIENLTAVAQDVNTTYVADKKQVAVKTDGSIAFNPNGQGGILRAMVRDGKIKWLRDVFRARGINPQEERILHFNGDNLIDEDLIYLAAGTTASNPAKKCVNFTYAYPKGAKYGVICLVRKPDGSVRLENVEYKERPKVAGLEEACKKSEAAGKLQCNGNILLFSLEEGVEQRISNLTEHAQLDKVTDEVAGNTDKAEYFLPDMMGQYDKEEVLLVTVDPFPGIKNPQALAEIKQALLDVNLGIAKQLGITVEEGAVIEFKPGFNPAKARVGKDCVVRRGARLYIGTDDIEIGDNMEMANGTTRIVGNGRVTIGSYAKFVQENTIVVVETDAPPVKLAGNTGYKNQTFGSPNVMAIKHILDAVATGLIVGDNVTNARGELMVPGMPVMADQVNADRALGEADGARRMTAERAQMIISAMPLTGRFFRREVRMYSVSDEGRRREIPRTVYNNAIYERVVRFDNPQMSDEEIDYCLDNIQENRVGRLILLYVRGMREKEWPEQDKAKGDGYNALWSRITGKASFKATLESQDWVKRWLDISVDTMIDSRTGLVIGNPDRPPFGDPEAVDYQTLMADIWTRTTVGVFSVSGLRQIFDPTFGDYPLTRFPCRYAIGTELTPAAKCHAAAQTQLFAEMLDDPAAFADRVPKLKDQTVAEQKDIKAKFARLLAETQRGKTTGRKKKIGILLDTRSTGPALADIIARTLLAQGVDVEYGFVGSVCEAAVFAKENKDVDGIVYISASHNDEGYNGVKLLLGDGRVMPEDIAYPFIFVLRGDHPSVTGPGRVKGVLEDPAYVRNLVGQANAVPAHQLRAVYSGVPAVKQRSRKADRDYRDKVITGAETVEAAAPIITAIRERFAPLKLAVVVDPNGGAREEEEYFQRLGIKVYPINRRHRYDMKHELCPSTTAVQETDAELARIREEAAKEGYTVIGSFHYDTDGDRRNFRPVNEQGEFTLRGDMAQICFALDIMGYMLSEENYDFKAQKPKRLIGISVNCPTSTLIEELAEILGFIIIRRQTGEANVVDGMTRLGGMKWGQVKQFTGVDEEEIIVPDCLREQFANAEYDDDAITIIAAGEGSNGSDFTPQLLVRDPLHTIRTLIHLLNPETGKKAVKTLLARMGRGEEFNTSWSGVWDNPDSMSALMNKLIGVLPPSGTTDFFSIGGRGEKINPAGLPLGLVKDDFDQVFEDEFRDETVRELAGIWGVNPSDIRYIYVNTEDYAKVGIGNRSKRAAVGRQIGDGGYKVKFFLNKGGKRRTIGWMWFRDSITETGLTRRGADSVFPVSLMPNASRAQQEALVARTQQFLDNTLSRVMNKAIAIAMQQVITSPSGLEDQRTILDPALELYRKELESSRAQLVKWLKARGETFAQYVAGIGVNPRTLLTPLATPLNTPAGIGFQLYAGRDMPDLEAEYAAEVAI